MRFEAFSFGSIRIDGVTYEHDVVIDYGHVRKRKKKASKRFREEFGHTPLSVEEEIPWDLPPPGNRHRRRCAACHGGSEARSQAPQSRTPNPADNRGNRGAEREPKGDERHPACNLLNNGSLPPGIETR